MDGRIWFRVEFIHQLHLLLGLPFVGCFSNVFITLVQSKRETAVLRYIMTVL